MDMRAGVWSPLQNIAIWLGAWLYGHESTDALLDAFCALFGEPKAANRINFGDILAEIRAAVPLETNVGFGAPSPMIQLALWGPGDAPLFPAGSEAAKKALHHPDGAIIIRSSDALRHLVLFNVEQTSEDSRESLWDLDIVNGPLPAPAWLSPGDADALLAEATNESAALVENSDYVRKDLPSPRLTIGTLTDFYETPGLPACTPSRAAKLFSRADTVAAIVETVTSRIGEHSLDPALLRLGRSIRQARMAGVSYSISEFARIK